MTFAMNYVYKRKGTKTEKVARFMTENSSRSMSELVPEIMRLIDVTESNAVYYYKWIVENGRAPGVIEGKRTKVSVAVAPVTKPDLLSDALEVYHDDSGISPEQLLGEVSAELRAEEEAEIRAANLQKIKEAAERFKAAE